MTALSTPFPVTRTPDPAPEPRGSASAFGAILGALFTFGLYPAFAWPGRWAATADAERPFLTDLAQWWRGHANRRDAAKLDAITARFRPRPMATVVPWLAAAFVAVAFAVWVGSDGPSDPLAKLCGDVTYRYHRDGYAVALYPSIRSLHGLWQFALFAAYFVHWYAVRSHVSAVSDLVAVTNKLAGGNRDTRVRDDAGRLGLGPVWVLTAVALCFHHAWWAIPMVLAGANQRRYTTKAGPRVLAALSAQARDRTSPTRPTGTAAAHPPPDAFHPATSAATLIACPAPACGAELPAVARFCSRCGTPVGG